MKYVDEFHDMGAVSELVGLISHRLNNLDVTLMEVCGTHTMTVYKHGLRSLLPPNLKLLSGPGCPVCVTPIDYVNRAVAVVRTEGVIVTTFGDMMRVPGSSSNLEREKSAGYSVRSVYSTLDALKIAEANPDRKIVFLGVGFETTAPTVAASILEAYRKGLTNYFVLTAHKVMPPPMRALASDPEIGIDGFICPGHVSIIIGSRPYAFLAKEFGIPCVIAGFEPIDVLQAILILIEQIVRGQAEVEIQYRRVVKEEGNRKALELLDEVFISSDSVWRGLGLIPGSGLRIKEKYSRFDAELNFNIDAEVGQEPKGCLCGDVLKGKVQPIQCPLFTTVCTPENPIGACMVSSEGACATHYKYGR